MNGKAQERANVRIPIFEKKQSRNGNTVVLLKRHNKQRLYSYLGAKSEL